MKIRIFFTTLLSMSLIGSAYAAEDQIGCRFGHQTLSSMVCYGPTILKQTTVTGNAQIAGPMTATGVEMGSMTIIGASKLQDATVSGQAEIDGELQASETDFEKDLSVAASNIMLDNSSVDGSIKITSENDVPHVKVLCGSIVTGSITFNGVPGVVEMSEDSIIEGDVVNGKIEGANKKC